RLRQDRAHRPWINLGPPLKSPGSNCEAQADQIRRIDGKLGGAWQVRGSVAKLKTLVKNENVVLSARLNWVVQRPKCEGFVCSVRHYVSILLITRVRTH
ncbi:MAG: hypothetical protein ACRC14_04360, partial [Paracoccaceae bacterium]